VARLSHIPRVLPPPIGVVLHTKHFTHARSNERIPGYVVRDVVCYASAMNPLHATIEEFAADGYTHVDCYCPRRRMTRLRPISWLPRISLGLTNRTAIGATALCRRRSESVTRALPYLYLALAIAFEVVGTSALKASETLTRLVPSLVTLIAYTASFVFLALSLRTIPIGIAYAIWAGLGIVLIALVGWFWFRQTLDVPALIGLALIVGGVVLVNAFSQSLPH
jgi:small multidrug resistance pump